MARRRTNREGDDPSKIRFVQPDRSGPRPDQETLLDIAQAQGLFHKAKQDGQQEPETDEADPLIGRTGESVMWSISLSMLHFTFDVLVQHQYAVDIQWPSTCKRGLQAFV
ncbi:MAG: hypothetical protein M1818_007316, partial [Claussenomyces sp. TS43310]